MNVRLGISAGVFAAVINYIMYSLIIDWTKPVESVAVIEKHYYYKDVLIVIDSSCTESGCKVTTDSGVVYTDIQVESGDWIQELCYLTIHYEDTCVSWNRYTPNLPDRESIRRNIKYAEKAQ